MSHDWAKEWRDTTDDTKPQSSKQDEHVENGDRSRRVKGEKKKHGSRPEAECAVM